jgi:hypothetical protein
MIVGIYGSFREWSGEALTRASRTTVFVALVLVSTAVPALSQLVLLPTQNGDRPITGEMAPDEPFFRVPLPRARPRIPLPRPAPAGAKVGATPATPEFDPSAEAETVISPKPGGAIMPLPLPSPTGHP